MKKFTILFAMLIMLSMIVEASKLSIKLYDNSLFTVVVDDQRFSTPTSHFKLNSISNGKHLVKIIKHVPSHHGYSTVNSVVYKGFINIPGASSVFASLNHFNKLVVTKVVKHKSHGSYIYGHNNSCHVGNSGTNGYYEDTYLTNEYGESCSGANGYYEDYSFGMPYSTFESLKYTMLNVSFDSKKLTIAKQAISANGITSSQVLDLMTMLTFESNKLDLAQFSYGYTVDRNSYYLVNNAFTFSSSIDELNDYIYGTSW